MVLHRRKNICMHSLYCHIVLTDYNCRWRYVFILCNICTVGRWPVLYNKESESESESTINQSLNGFYIIAYFTVLCNILCR